MTTNVATLFLILFLSFTLSNARNITVILEDFPDFSLYNSYLTKRLWTWSTLMWLLCGNLELGYSLDVVSFELLYEMARSAGLENGFGWCGCTIN